MIVLLAVLAATRASPVGIPPAPFVFVSHDQLQPSCDDLNECRSLVDIIRSCVLTILLCTWASMHPNIPNPDARWPEIALRRAGLMLAALIIPEGIVAWALRQRRVAVKLAKQHKGEGWTITHGFFATMGGFMEYKGNRPIRVLLPDQLESYSLTGNGDFPRIAKAEIEDRSKGDAISKAFVIVQTGWFVTQCIARGVQGLAITELELITLAFASLNFVIYLLWWEKPQNVHRGVRVYQKRETEQPIDDGDIEATPGFWVSLGHALISIPAAIVRGPLTNDVDFSRKTWLFRVLIWPVTKPLSIISGEETEYPTLKRVSTFYPTGYATTSFNIGFLMAVTLAFGSIHCIGWSFTFPSSTEQALWRSAAVSITIVPIVYVLLRHMYYEMVPPNLRTIATIVCMLPVFLYTLDRLALLVLPFLGLRSLPPAAYKVVHWTLFVPHV